MRKPLLAAAVVTAMVPALLVGAPASAATATEYTVVAGDGVSPDAATAAIAAVGGTILSRNDAVGVYEVTSTRDGFSSAVAASDNLIGASPRRAIGFAPSVEKPIELPIGPAPAAGSSAAAKSAASPSAAVSSAAAPKPGKMDPLDDRLWGLTMIHADLARKLQKGNRGVTVGVLDTGLDASHPDLAPHFIKRLSRNFAADIPDVDGPCEVAGCVDPVGTDDGGHGTHVAGIIGAAADGSGVSGVAPKVGLVELKGGQDSGYFFLDPVVNALTYAADAGIDVVNMSFYVDPWLYNCTANAADGPEARAEQQAIIVGIQRALNYAHDGGVTLVGALGNQHDDLGNPRDDASSPDYGTPSYPRDIDNADCLSLPAEGDNVIAVSSVGPSGAKAAYSNYGTEQTSLAAPGGWTQDLYGTPQYNKTTNNVLSTYPLSVLRASGAVDADGNPTTSSVLKDCSSGTCGYYRYLAGTSMASPHVAGVAALIISQYGNNDWKRGGLKMNPDAVRRILFQTATEHACPKPRLRSYAQEGFSAEYDAYCDGGSKFNGFYGHGIVDAYAAVGGQ
ncbi:S8 family serine peptidase [Mangrovihabitans endophyticus]|uniref:Serine protease n=1 Tax=Mangrovihabitans endophyticus TaxID=1751298 RepID=A0A8J3BVW0_9ACTN|nr:S8 family serine peptidase [Mangrovihabitans endophyticus]GGK82247.1 serine protease [Mangrovihabitans endophyticus]